MSPSRPVSSKLLAFLVLLACVVVSAAGIGVSEAPENFEVMRGTIGHPVSINGGEVIVDHVRVGSSLVVNGAVKYRTPGMFVAARVTAAAPGAKRLVLGSAQLTRGDRTYLPYSALTRLHVDPGFESTQDYIFEVDPSRIDGLSIELWEGEIVSGYHQRVTVPVGITTRNAGQLRIVGRQPISEPQIYASTRALP